MRVTQLRYKRLIVCFSALLLISTIPILALGANFQVSGEVKTSLDLSLDDLKRMPSFRINNIAFLGEKKAGTDQEKLIEVASYKGVLVRDILDQAGMKFTRKYEPGVFMRMRGADKKEIVLSFGEVFYSSIGRSILLAYEKNGKPLKALEMVISTDVRSGRRIMDAKEILVERVPIRMKAYEDKKENVFRPPSSVIVFADMGTHKTENITLDQIKSLPVVHVEDAVMTGDCEGFKGVFFFEGQLLRTLLQRYGVVPSEGIYGRYVVVTSDDGFCATFSLGEILNSRLSDNIIVAYIKNEVSLKEDGFARSVVREDSTGGRSVRRISRIEVH